MRITKWEIIEKKQDFMNDLELEVGTVIVNKNNEEIALIRHTREEIEDAFEEDKENYNEGTYYDFLLMAGHTYSTATDDDRYNFWRKTEDVMMEIDDCKESGGVTSLGDSIDSANIINYIGCVHAGLSVLEDWHEDPRIQEALDLITLQEEKLQHPFGSL